MLGYPLLPAPWAPKHPISCSPLGKQDRLTCPSAHNRDPPKPSSHVAAAKMVPSYIRSQFNTVPSPAVPWPGQEAYIYRARISLRDIQNMPTLWVLALFGIFYKFCFHVQTCRHLWGGGVCVYFLKSARKSHFRNVWVGGEGVVTFFSVAQHIGWWHTNMALHRSSIFTLNHCHRQHSLFQAGLGPH